MFGRSRTKDMNSSHFVDFALICVEFVIGILSAIVAIILIVLLNYQDLRKTVGFLLIRS